ncbi:MAG: type II secretion system F family protein [Polaromonas sp.]|nr:type II secretion system F family protein [Polaromonas sp.]
MSQNLLYAVLALVFLLVAGAAVALGSLWSRRLSGRSRAMSGRLDVIAQKQRAATQDPLRKSGQQDLATWLQWVLTYVPGLRALDVLIMRAGRHHKVANVLTLSAGLSLLAWLLMWLAGLQWALALAAGLFTATMPTAYLKHLEKNRRLLFENQLPEALDFVTRALRAGHGLTVALGMVGDELPAPVGSEFKTTFDHINLGMSFDEAMGDLAERIQSSDLNFLVIALTIQRKTGGNLAELLSTLSGTVRERIKLKGKIRVLASEGKLSGVMIGALPFVLGLILSFVNPVYMATLWTTPAGQKLVLAGLVMMLLGALWMWKIVQIKV